MRQRSRIEFQALSSSRGLTTAATVSSSLSRRQNYRAGLSNRTAARNDRPYPPPEGDREATGVLLPAGASTTGPLAHDIVTAPSSSLGSCKIGDSPLLLPGTVAFLRS